MVIERTEAYKGGKLNGDVLKYYKYLTNKIL